MAEIFITTENDNSHYILQDLLGNILCDFYIEDKVIVNPITIDDIIIALTNPFICPTFRVSILNPDETIKYVIPLEDIPSGGISYTETYQNGQRRSITLKLINKDGKYSPSINRGNKYYKNFKNDKVIKVSQKNTDILIWKNTKFRYDVGLKIKGNKIWFPKGIYILESTDLIQEDSNKQITLQLNDKFAKLEGNSGKLLTAYEITVGSNIKQVIQDLLNTDFGDGYNLDNKMFMLPSSLYNFKIKADIKKEAGDTYGSIFLDIATQMSCECFYNEHGNLVFSLLDETVNDQNKSVCWKYEKKRKDLINLSPTYNFNDAINMVKVIGDNVDNGIFSALVVNHDPRSPICIGRIGKCPETPITDANVWSNVLAKDLAIYNLRKKSLISLSLSANVKFNPLITVDFLCEIEHEFFNFEREKCVINSISYSDNSGQMDLSITAIQNLDFLNMGDGGYEI